jgi:glycosyltransferase involved in cell wall biosynthesis
MFPMNWLAARAPAPTVQLCYEPFAHFYDYDMINSMSFAHRTARNLLRRLYGRYDQAGVRRAAAVLTLSARNAAWIEEIYGRTDAAVTYEGVDTAFFHPTAAPDLAARYKGRKLIMHSTDFSPIKGTEYLIRALPAIVAAVPETKLLITSTMSGTGKQNAERLAQNLGVAGNIEYLGFLASDDVPKFYTLADVVIQPSVNQTMSLSVKEAMACETPVIRSADTTEEVIDGVSGYLVDPRDAELLAQRTITILKDEGLAGKMGRAGRQRIVEFFTWEAVADKIWAALSSAATRRGES